MARPSNTIERRTQIARALLTVMAREGYERASIADVARVAGVAPGLVHYHFENKLEILVAAAHELGQDYEARLDRALAPAVGDPEAELSAFVDAHLRVGKGADPAALACWIDVSGESLREPRVREVAASILAKHARDQYMDQMDTVYPQYAFACHKGYATAQHRRLLAVHGPCPLHRRSFAPVETLLGGAGAEAFFDPELEAYLEPGAP